MSNKMPKLEAGMMIYVDWGMGGGGKRYLYLGGESTIDLDNDSDRSQPLRCRLEDVEITQVYTIGGTNSYASIKNKDRHYDPKLIWEKKVKTEAEVKLEELEKIVQDAQEKIQVIKKSL